MKNKLPAIHPGEFLAEILGEIDVSQAAFARAAGVSAMRVSHVVTGAHDGNIIQPHSAHEREFWQNEIPPKVPANSGSCGEGG